MIPRADRVSIDLDSKNQFILLKTHFNMEWILRLYNKKDEVVNDKETNKGFHVIGEFKNRTPEQNIYIRTVLNDCEGRLELDERRLKAGLEDCIETKFFYKKIVNTIKMKNGKLKKITVISRETDYNIMSQQFWGVKHGR